MYMNQRIVKFWIGPKDIKNIEAFIDKYQNPLFIKRNNEWYFQSRYYDTIEKIYFKIINLISSNENIDYFNQIIRKIALDSIKYAKNLETDEHDVNDFVLVPDIKGEEERNMYLRFNSFLNKFFYFEDWGIIDFATEIFVFLLQSHFFKNGNKRFALSFLYTFLKYAGFYVKWSTIPYFSLLNNKTFMYKNNLDDWLEDYVVLLSSRTSFDIKNDINTNNRKLNYEIHNSFLDEENTSKRQEITKKQIKSVIKGIITIEY